ncbi:hypothetical protein [Mucilaginibacter paludis]|uniref:Uncharacterized protein n=1 Tax=Mucilaginibacter paludis DSM 18603 TaxID=714943 RepID=H1YC89_9SPHI|nr:hypothetical protein [Mucilaginibacter paludis]EHQ30080.1 hypothetical protein Mucpa_6021 [Mucilaginibacter paludis DSM 18603]
MQAIPSTYQILAYKVLGQSIDDEWVNWAVEMLQAGFDTESLTILAGVSPFYNQFELQALTDRVFNELQLDYSDAEAVLANYTSFLATVCLAGQRDYLAAFRSLKDIHIGLGYASNFTNFYTLYFAKADLLVSEHQWYWPGADRSNIDAIMKAEFEAWLAAHPLPGFK